MPSYFNVWYPLENTTLMVRGMKGSAGGSSNVCRRKSSRLWPSKNSNGERPCPPGKPSAKDLDTQILPNHSSHRDVFAGLRFALGDLITRRSHQTITTRLSYDSVYLCGSSLKYTPPLRYSGPKLSSNLVASFTRSALRILSRVLP
jgi:hypothetical protein